MRGGSSERGYVNSDERVGDVGSLLYEGVRPSITRTHQRVNDEATCAALEVGMRLASHHHPSYLSPTFSMVGLHDFQSIQMSLGFYVQHPDFCPASIYILLDVNIYRNGPCSATLEEHKYSLGTFPVSSASFNIYPSPPLQLPATHLLPLMITHRKNKFANPGIPDMTPSQLSSAGLSHASSAHCVSGKKKLTKDQQIVALQDELRTAQELILSVCPL